ncbi:MAG: glycoside hydrolase family 43 protein [Povalibacter sp.]
MFVSHYRIRSYGALAVLCAVAACSGSVREPAQTAASTPTQGQPTSSNASKFLTQPLITELYTADPSAHVFQGKLYIYPSHDIETGVPQDAIGSRFDMKDYHVFSMTSIPGQVKDHGVALALQNVPWASKQLWAPDAAEKDGKYYLYFPAKDKQGVFRIGVAVSRNPAGPFVAQPDYIKGTFSIDPAVYQDDREYYIVFGGIRGGQLQRWSKGSYSTDDVYPGDDQPALTPKIAKLSADMLSLAEAPKDVVLQDEAGKPLLSGDNSRRYFEAPWIHKYKGLYYLSYSTGDTHFIVYATSHSPYGPYTYRGKVLEPVQGWTNHQSIVEYHGKWYLFYHDTQLSGKTHLRNIKVVELKHRADGSIEPVDAYFE